MNFCAEQVKQGGRGFPAFKNYCLRALLHARGVTWPVTVQAPRLSRTRPHCNRKSPTGACCPGGSLGLVLLGGIDSEMV